jgi:hypothetical protein
MDKNKKLARNICKIIKSIDADILEISDSGILEHTKDTRKKLFETVIHLGYEINQDYELLKIDDDIVSVNGHSVKYWYMDGYDEIMEDGTSTYDHVGSMLDGGYIEGELSTYDEEDINHRGWWIKL